MNDDTATKLLHAQDEVTSIVRERLDEDSILRAAHLLRDALSTLSSDEEFWADVQKADSVLRSQSAVQLELLARVDWLTVLDKCGYRGSPPRDWVAFELVQEIRAAAMSEGDASEILHSRVSWLAQRLSHHLETSDQPRTRRWRRRLRRLVSMSYDVLRRVNYATLIWDALKEGGKKAVEVGLLALVAAPELAPIAIAAAALAGAAGAAIEGIRDANRDLKAAQAAALLDETKQAKDDVLTELFRAAGPGPSGSVRSEVNLARMVIEEQGLDPSSPTSDSPALAEVIRQLTQRASAMAAAAGASLAAAWVYGAVNLDGPGEAAVQAVGDAVRAVQWQSQQLRDSPAVGISTSLLDGLVTAVDSLATTIESLGTLLINSGVLSHGSTS